MKYIISLLFFDKEKYLKIKEDARDENWAILRNFSGIIGIALLALALFGFITSESKDVIHTYAIFGVVCFIFIALSYIKIKNSKTKEGICFAFLLILLFFGIIMGTVLEPKDQTLTFIVIMIAVPLLYTSRAIVINTLIGFSVVFYLSIAYNVQSHQLFIDNLYNVVAYAILSFFATALVMRGKLSNLFLIAENAELVKKKMDTQLKYQNMESFINDMVRYATSEGTPDEAIKQVLKYIGQKLQSDHAYIIECNGEGCFESTYEWWKEGVSKENGQLQKVPYDIIMGSWAKNEKECRSILISDIDDYKESDPALYNIVCARGVKSLATGAIFRNGEIEGFYGVDNPPMELFDDLTEVIEMIEFFISFIMKLKDNERNLEYLAHHDQLTGCQNRQALKKYYSVKQNEDKPLGVLMCDVNGLKTVNDTLGHEAGDNLIESIANTLMSVFGKDNIYRIGGDEFVAVLPQIKFQQFEKQIQLLRKQLGSTISIGTSYKEKMDTDLDSVIRLADIAMYEEKRAHYMSKNDN